MRQIFESIKSVVEKSKHVSINTQKLGQFANDFSKADLGYWLTQSPVDLSGLDQEQLTAFLFTFNSISFSYWGDPKWKVNYHNETYDGSWAMIACLGRALESGKPVLDPQYQADLSEKEMNDLLKGNVRIPLFYSRWDFLKELGTVVQEEYQGKFSNVVESARGDALHLLDTLVTKFKFFEDTSIYESEPVYFYKRAQLLTSDLNHAFPGTLKNADQLTSLADYKIPQGMRKAGILEYSPDLSLRIDNLIEIPAESGEEIEIRANQIFAVEWIKNITSHQIPDVTAIDISDYFWLAGQTKHPDEKPYHRTRTTAY